jgi:hypothetical protein
MQEFPEFPEREPFLYSNVRLSEVAETQIIVFCSKDSLAGG